MRGEEGIPGVVGATGEDVSLRVCGSGSDSGCGGERLLPLLQQWCNGYDACLS